MGSLFRAMAVGTEGLVPTGFEVGGFEVGGFEQNGFEAL
jgi:hypothetical protein